MTKSLQILLGLLLILVLAYVAFLDVSTKIKDDLLTKTKVMFSENNVKNVSANMQGEGSSMSRTLVLTGTAISELERNRIVTLTENIEGVCSIDNQIKLHPAVPKVVSVPIVPTIAPNVPTVIKVPVVKTSTESVMLKSEEKKKIVEVIVEKKEPISISDPKVTTTVPAVPSISTQNIVVPTPIKAIAAPEVIKIENIKLEGVK